MKKIAVPLFFSPMPMEKVWGGSRLGRLHGKKLPPGKPIGESWELSDRPEAESRVVGGPHDGATLAELRAQAPQALLGEALAARSPARFPLLIKYVDAGQDLSVQVHPDDDGAKKLGIPDRGKTECWVIVHADPGARIQRGLKPGVTRASFEDALKAGRVEEALHYFPAKAGDVVAIPPGMIHAICAGVVLAEIQQNSDVTFRVFDYNRMGLDGKPRALHVKESLETIGFGEPAAGYFGGDMTADTVEGVVANLGPARHEFLLKGRYFDLHRTELQAGQRFALQRDGRAPTVMMVLKGRGTLDGRAMAAGQTLLLPADLPPGAGVIAADPGEALVWLESTPTPEA
ncbi:MAG: class I mannose-6-phosphate isomerase [Planctomycetota bacterium]|nr:class I mannose-6-phosphate isomerase [Planctomycetota bacterium]